MVRFTLRLEIQGCQKLEMHRNVIILYTTMVETLRKTMPEFWRANLLCTLVFSPVGSHLNEKEKNWQKSKICRQSLYTFGRDPP